VELSSCGSQAASLEDSQALLGKILRIDVDATTGATENDNLCSVGDGNAAEYAVPGDNPFADDPDACGEVFLYGLRNPWRFSFDRVAGDLWIGDVGQGQWEEIDLLEAPVSGGANLGWDCYEGSSTFESAGCPPDAELTFPVLEYPRDSPDCSVTGGYRYRGPVFGLEGFYVYGDYCSGDIRVAEEDGGNWQATVVDRFDTGFGLRSFGEDQAGNLYVVASGTVYRFEGPTDLIFENGFEG
ncbi:MAG: PQQ-dependent sugar dehydrogenase, partial [Candidatus Wenzhouxiangella sp. M2_3B_020]